MDLTAAAKNHFMELNELIELRDGAYENTRIYKERAKRWHDSRIRGDKNFKVGDKVLLFNSRFKMHPGKLKSRWYDPNVVKIVYPYGTVEITDKNGISFKVNGQRLKKYHNGHIDAEDKEVVEFEEDTTLYLRIAVIMEYLVKTSKKARILELKRRHLKITVLTSNTPENPADIFTFVTGITSIKVNGKNAYELKGKFLVDLHNNAFSGTNGEDTVEHIE
ncbi:hypothetical protein Tco_1090924 [Tanacetum coccineum]|uniref:Uncharacterized protein n=1 Tax=Tanacetum coccineum TaxID=301880 RepID=A0ABQ5I5T3_9ASTR